VADRACRAVPRHLIGVLQALGQPLAVLLEHLLEVLQALDVLVLEGTEPLEVLVMEVLEALEVLVLEGPELLEVLVLEGPEILEVLVLEGPTKGTNCTAGLGIAHESAGRTSDRELSPLVAAPTASKHRSILTLSLTSSPVQCRTCYGYSDATTLVRTDCMSVLPCRSLRRSPCWNAGLLDDRLSQQLLCRAAQTQPIWESHGPICHMGIEYQI